MPVPERVPVPVLPSALELGKARVLLWVLVLALQVLALMRVLAWAWVLPVRSARV